METILDWLSGLDLGWLDSYHGLLVAVVAYLVLRRRQIRRYRHLEQRDHASVESSDHDLHVRGYDVETGRAAPDILKTDRSKSSNEHIVLEAGVDNGGSASDETAPPTFHFRFEGEACHGRALLRDRKVRLIFAQGAATSLLQSVSFTGRKFLALLQKEARLTVAIWPGEGLDALGSDVAVVRFRDGLLLGEVAFDLFVTKECPAEVSVTAEFFAGGTKLYGLTFSTHVHSEREDELPAFAAGSRPPGVVDLDVVAALEVSGGGHGNATGVGDGDLLLTLELVVGGLMMNLVHTSAEAGMVSVGKALNAELDKSSLQTLMAQIRAELGAAFYASDVWDRSTLKSLSATEMKDMAECFKQVASAGSLLNRALRSDNADAAKLFDYIEARPAGTRLTIATSKVFLPFEILYPHEFSMDSPQEERGVDQVVRNDFWGAKFGLEVSYVGAGDYLALVRAHRRAPRAVSLNLNETIAGTGSPTPMEIHGQLQGALKDCDVACDSSSQCDQMKKVLLGAGTGSRLVYVYCHGSAADPIAGIIEELHLSDGPCVVRPTAVSGGRYRNAPIVFLNACYGGATSPMFFTGFLEFFRKKGALGLIATSFPVPVMFGAQFGADVVTECMLGSGSLGERMRRLRMLHADQGNPVPLFYSVQCQLSS